jgi:hypothetical protein
MEKSEMVFSKTFDLIITSIKCIGIKINNIDNEVASESFFFIINPK